jgi:hypothetical protein
MTTIPARFRVTQPCSSRFAPQATSSLAAGNHALPHVLVGITQYDTRVPNTHVSHPSGKMRPKGAVQMAQGRNSAAAVRRMRGWGEGGACPCCSSPP